MNRFEYTYNANVSVDRIEKNFFESIENLSTEEEKINMIISTITEVFKNAYSSVDYIERIVTKHADDEFKHENELIFSVRVTIVKQFLKNIEHIKNSDYKLLKIIKFILGIDSIGKSNIIALQQQAVEKIDESTFEKYFSFRDESIKLRENKKIEEYKYLGKTLTVKEEKKIKSSVRKDRNKELDSNFFLFKLADELANAKFRASNKTIQYLYWFAIAFNMSIKEVQDELFEDYYNANIINYIQQSPKDINNVIEPTGAGINYKNFVELIYLYNINKRNLSATERMKNSLLMINDCKNSYKQKRVQIKKSYYFTKQFKRDFYSHINDDSSQFIDFICDTCYIDDDNIYTLDSSQETAEDYLGIIMQNINPNQVLKYSNYDELLDVLEPVTATYKATKIVIDSINFDFEYYEPKDITRQVIIAAYFRMFLSNLDSNIETLLDCNSFYDYYYAFKDGESYGTDESLDEILEMCRYQKMSFKNFYDRIILLLLYVELLSIIKTSPKSNYGQIIRNKNNQKVRISKTLFTIGRASDSDFVVSENECIGRKHLTIVAEDDNLFAIDNYSTNGSSINGSKLKPGKKYLLKDKDIIKLYDEGFTLLL